MNVGMLPLGMAESVGVFEKLPVEARKWAEKLHWNERRYVLSLCHILCAATPEQRAEFLDEYTADGLVNRLIEDKKTKQKVEYHLQQFHLETQLSESLLRIYIRQFYIHYAQDAHRKPDQYLEVALRLMGNCEENNNAFNYTLGFELLKMIFQMSWLQQERLYLLQKNQEFFIKTYIKPIRKAHVINGIIVPKDKQKFFAKRDYYVQIPRISPRKIVELVMATFSAKVVTDLGFSAIRHAQSVRFDYDYIFNSEIEDLIPV